MHKRGDSYSSDYWKFTGSYTRLILQHTCKASPTWPCCVYVTVDISSKRKLFRRGIIYLHIGSGNGIFHLIVYVCTATSCFLKGDARMVNREQEVMDRVQSGHVSTGSLGNVFEMETFN